MSWGLADIVQQPAQGAPVPAAQGAVNVPVIDVGPSYNPATPAGSPGSEIVQAQVPPGTGQPNGQLGGTANSGTVTYSRGASSAPGKWGLSDIAISPASPAAAPSAPPQTAAAQPAPWAPAGMPPAPGGQSWGDLLATFGRGTAAALEGIPRGILGGKAIDYGEAALNTPLNMVYGVPAGQQPVPLVPGAPQPANAQQRFMGPVAAFNQALQEQQQAHNTLQQQVPISEIGGQAMGGLGLGIAAAPLMGWKAPPVAASLVPKLASAGDYIARNAAMGSLMSYLSGTNPYAGAAIGAALPALHTAGAGIAALPPASWVSNLAPILSQGAREASVANTLGHDLGASVPQTSQVGPLDLAQATNNPNIAYRADLAPKYAPEVAADLRQAQQEAVGNQIGQIGAPAEAPDAAARLTQGIRAANDAADAQESALWNAPPLRQQKVPTVWLKSAMNKAVQALDPGLSLGVTGPVKDAVGLMERMPEQASVGDLNSVRSALLRIARRPPLDNPTVAPVAGRLASAFMDAMDQTLSISNVDPAIRQAYAEARNFTRSYHGEAFNPPAIRAVVAERNGAPAANASEVSRRLFNFSFGAPEGPEALNNLTDFVRKLKGQNSGQLADNIKDAARSYIAAALRNVGNLNDGQVMTPARIQKIQDFIRKNGSWMRTSGLLDQSQVKAMDDLSEYLGMLRRPEQLLRETNSATQSRMVREKTFVAEIMNPWVRRLGEWAITLGGGHHGGIVGGMVGMGLSSIFEGGIARAEGEMREMMARALLDPQYAQMLRMKASSGNRALLSPRVRGLLQAEIDRWGSLAASPTGATGQKSP
jgi:hypothetical protein